LQKAIFQLQAYRFEHWRGFQLIGVLAGIAAKPLRIDHIILATSDGKAPLDVSAIADVDG